MKGLFIKDFYLLVQRKMSVLMFFAISLMMAFMNGESNFVIPYTGMLITIWALSTLSFDESDNGFPFLMTLPITKSKYIIEKILFCTGCGILGNVVAILFCNIASLVQGNGPLSMAEIIISFLYIPFYLVAIDITLPVQIKYGQEKSRFALILIVVIIGIAAYSIVDRTGFVDSEIINIFKNMSDSMFICLAYILGLVITVISYFVSIKVFVAKEL